MDLLYSREIIMSDIKKVIICGLGAIGLTYANKLKDCCDLKILANQERIDKYRQDIPQINGEKVLLDYISPQDSYEADLIIIATKASGLNSAISYIKNFIGKNTIIISLLNGTSSEEEISKIYGWDNLLYSYFIGHSAMRTNNSVTQDGVGKIVFGGENKTKVERLKNFFELNNIEYEIPKDIIYSLWLKLGINVYLNQSSAILNMTMGEMKNHPRFLDFGKKLINEVKNVAEKNGVNGLEHFEQEALNALELMSPDGKSSMLQDILANRKTEVEIFAGEIIRRGKIYGIPTPYNQVVYDLIRLKEA
jgi:2-dehydropantoate 2-reductase